MHAILFLLSYLNKLKSPESYNIFAWQKTNLKTPELIKSDNEIDFDFYALLLNFQQMQKTLTYHENQEFRRSCLHELGKFELSLK